MTVGKLIETLSKFDSNKKVYIIASDDNPLTGGLFIDNIFEINGSDKQEDNAVYILES